MAKDRTGETCPVCKKGKLYPTGGRAINEPAKRPKSGEWRREETEYECDKCHAKPKAFVEVVGESFDLTDKK